MRSLSHYTLTEQIFADAAHILYHGYRNADRTPVLIKLLQSEYPSQSEIARLRHEYAIAQAIGAPGVGEGIGIGIGVIKAHGLEKVGHGLGLILEHFDGRPLSELLRAGRLELGLALAIGSAAAEAIGVLHGHHIIHKDIRPENFLVDIGTGRIKLIGFGAATRLTQEAKRAGRPDALEGSLSYMSPEQTGRMNRALDHRTDLYSLGVTLYQMLAGTLPFPTTDPLELVHSLIARTPPPLRERAEGIPEVVSTVVMKLLAKAAEDRYQSARGLKADLDECKRRLRETGTITPFPLAQRDVLAELRIVQKLYGREAERDMLHAAFGRACEGGAELFLLSGYAGVGKSALVSELYQAIARGAGYFAAGKFDQRARNVPYTAIVAALRELVRHALAESPAALARWKASLLGALGANGQILIDLIPDLQILIGPQPPVPALGPTEAQNRFSFVFQSFLRVFTTREHPVVLFLDDLHWADPASLRLLSQLLLDPERGYLLIVGAYRDHEVGPADLLPLTLAELRKQGAVIRDQHLAPIDLASAEQLIADALNQGVDQVRPFARLVFDKTQGNPLFMGQFLRALHDGGEISFDGERGAFHVDLERVAAAMVTDNVIDFMVGKIKKLAPRTQRVLKLASCIGHRFDLITLAVISEMTPAATATALWESLMEGLVLPLDEGYQLAAEMDIPAEAGAPQPPAFNVSYQFLHDRVQQAAYSLIESSHQKEIHLRIGRLLYAQSDEQSREERLLEIVDHFNMGAPRIVDRDERRSIAGLNLRAGRRTKAAAAYQAAAGYFAAGTALLGEGSFGDEYATAFALHTELAECEYLTGRFKEAEAIFEILLSRAQSRLDRAQVYSMVVVLYTMRGQLAAALRAGRDGLALFGVSLPETEERLRVAFDAELQAIKAQFAGRRIADLIDAPRLTDPEAHAHLELLVKLRPSAFFSGPAISSVVIAMPVNLCIQHGLSELAEPIYSGIGYTLISIAGMYEEAREFFRLSLALAERSTEIRLRCMADVLLAGHAHFFIQFRKALPILTRAQRVGLQTGDFLFLSFACYHSTMIRMCAGEELGAVKEELDRCFALLKRTRNEYTTAILLVARQLIAALSGRTRGRMSLSDADFDEADHVATSKASGFGFAVAYSHYARLMLALLYGDYPSALEAADRVRETAGTSALFHYATDVPFYAGLALAALIPSATPADKERYAEKLRAYEAQIALWARHCAENYRHKQLLLGAEVARIKGRDAEAQDLYRKAIEVAREGEFVQHEALANERAALYAIERGQPDQARAHLDEAYQGYLRWGASEKAIALAERHAALLGATAVAAPHPAALTAAANKGSEGARLIDHMAMVRAAQAIAGEIVLERLLDRMMRIVVANAGADRGVLLLARNERLVVEATMTVDPDIVRIGRTAQSESPELAESVVQFVERTREPVVLGRAGATGPFSGDAYLAARPPKSLLCLAMVQKGRLAGILYLENHVANEAFTPERVELCSLLASQAAIAVENALLIDELQRRTAELDKSNKALEVANQVLRTTNQDLAHERAQAEAAREALKDELYRLKTPLIPITSRIMVMPLIGTINAERGQQILEAALEGVSANRAAVVILDVTGVQAIDGGVTGTVLHIAGALRLLGAQAVITGIRPALARELVLLNQNAGDLVTRGTLESGIAYAMSRLAK